MIEPVQFLDGRVRLFAGDCREVVAGMAEASVDSVVTDPPYHLASIVRRFANANPDIEHFARTNPTSAYRSASAGFMGKKWDGGDIAFDHATWAAILRVLKPGGHLVAFGGTRTYHRMVCAIEDAGFEIRDQLAWVFGSGFPKSHDVSKGIDRAAGKQGAFGDKKANVHSRGDHVLHEGWKRPWMDDPEAVDKSGREYIPADDEAARWQGWGTALKPAHEPICLARKPLIGTVAQNVLTHGTGAINIDGCRVASEQILSRNNGARSNDVYNSGKWQTGTFGTGDERGGRWPANLVHDGSDEVLAAFPDRDAGGSRENTQRGQIFVHGGAHESFNDSGSAARFFYSAKADSDDRIGSKHPTVKPIDLMRWLCRLITPPGGTILDPFAGTGTTGEAAFYEGFNAILIEREAEYQADIGRRMRLVMSGPDERASESMKAWMADKPRDDGPLFGGNGVAPVRSSHMARLK